MYERPQYLTPDGYRRLPKRPEKMAAKRTRTKAARADVALAKKNIRKLSSGGASRGISKEAAQLIALAIRAMLQQR